MIRTYIHGIAHGALILTAATLYLHQPQPPYTPTQLIDAIALTIDGNGEIWATEGTGYTLAERRDMDQLIKEALNHD